VYINFNIINELGSPAISSNTFANRPAPGQTGRLFVSIDTYEIYRDTGTGWDLIGGPGSSTVTGSGLPGQVTYWTGTNTVDGDNSLFYDDINKVLSITDDNTLLQLNGTNNAYTMYNSNLVDEYRVGYTNGPLGYQRFSIYDQSGTKEVITIDKISRRVGINYQYADALDMPTTTLGVAGSFLATATIQADFSLTAKLSSSTSIPAGYAGFWASSGTNSINFVNGTSGNQFWFLFPSGTSQLTIPSNSGTLALLSDIPSLAGYVPTSRTITINGNSQDLTADRTYSVGTVTSVGLSMPSAFTVTNSPITGSGSINVTGAGLATQYIRGDGQLANFPTNTGGGSSVSYYLNGSVNQGTFGGDTYYEMSRTPVLGAGTDFTISTNGYIAQFITDANDPAQLSIPSGNWNIELYLQASSGGGSPNFYIELYKYDGTTFTLITSNSGTPEVITGGTAIDVYLTSIAIPVTALSLTDRLAVRIYVNNDGRTITLHTENNTLDQIITTFSTGLTALNGLTNQVQYFATGTSGSDFNISSTSSTHTFNLPTASSANRGALSSTDWNTFNSKQNAILLTTTGSSGAATFVGSTLNVPNYTLAGLGGVPTSRSITINGTSQDLSADRSYSVGTVTSIATSSPLTGGTITGSGTIGIQQASSLLSGFLSSTDWITFNNKQSAISLTTTGSSGAANFVGSTLNVPNYTLAGLGGVPTSRSITINGTSQDLSANRSYSVGTVTSIATSSPLTGGTITGSGTIGIQVASSSADGYLSSTDWTTFNNKLSGSVSPNRFAVGTFPAGVTNGNISQSSINGDLTVENTTGTLVNLRSGTVRTDDVFIGFPTGTNRGSGKIKFSQAQNIGSPPATQWVLYLEIDGSKYYVNLTPA
jgi:hypothetical protein